MIVHPLTPLWLAAALAGCGAPHPREAVALAAQTRVAGAAPSAGPRAEPATPTTTDPQVMAAELVRLASAGDQAALGARVDWPYVKRLATMTGAFQPTPSDLTQTLSSLPSPCALQWRVADGGLRLDFPPSMVGDAPDVTAEKDGLKKELYQGRDVVAVRRTGRRPRTRRRRGRSSGSRQGAARRAAAPRSFGHLAHPRVGPARSAPVTERDRQEVFPLRPGRSRYPGQLLGGPPLGPRVPQK